MKPKTMILMVVAVGCGLGASFMTSKLLADRSGKSDAEPTVPVLVAKVRIPSALPIKDPEKYFEIKEYPQTVAPKKALASFAEIKDQRLKLSLDEGKTVTQDDLVNKESASLDYQLAPGQRAVAIKVNSESLVGGFVLPGTRVDIIHTTRGTDATAKMILQNMLVLAVDTIHKRDGEVQTILGQTITLGATPEEATRLSLASANGELRLLLKGANDNSKIANIVVNAGDLGKPLGQGADDKGVETSAQPSTAPMELPDLPPVEEKPMPAAPVPEAEKRPVRKAPKPHVLIIRNGLSVDKAIFRPDRNEDDPGRDDGGTDPANPERKDEKRPDDRAKPTPPAPKPAGAATPAKKPS